MNLPATPYSKDEILSFARERVSNVDQEIYVDYLPQDVGGKSRFYMERGRWNDYPHFMRITFDDLYNPDKEQGLIARIRDAGAKRMAAHAKNDAVPRTGTPTAEAIAYGKKCREAAEHMHQHPEDFLRHARERFEHYGPAMEYAVRRGGDNAVKGFVKEVERLPPWMQVHVMEGDGLYLHSNSPRRIESGMKGITWKLFGAGGQYRSYDATDVDGKHLHAVDITSFRDRSILLHEEGHHVSHELVSNKTVPAEGGFAELKCEASRLPKWQAAVNAHKLHLSPESIGLKLHLSSYPRECHAEEVFAETTRHYAEKYAKHGGNAAKVDKAMTRALPDIWPTYRDEILPECERQAAKLYEIRASSRFLPVPAKLGELEPEALKQARAAGNAVHGVAGEGALAAHAAHIEPPEVTHAASTHLSDLPHSVSGSTYVHPSVGTGWASRIKYAVKSVLAH